MDDRVLLSSFGSAGDVFPLVPLVAALRDRGQDVRVAAPRGAGLYLRALGIPTVGLGTGSELTVVDDPASVTARFGGWASWRRTALHYVAPTVEGDVASLDRAASSWAPDVVVATGFAAAARVHALRAGIPLVDLSIYPQHDALGRGRGRHFAPGLRSVVADLLGREVDDPLVARAAWGAPADVVLHDRALLGRHHPDLAPVGYPHWDDLPAKPRDVEEAESFLDRRDGAAIVTFGSFLGLTQRERWAGAARALAAAGRPVLLVGPPRDWVRDALPDLGGVEAVGFVPLSRILPRASLAVHHGGLGTSMAALRAEVPALVLPLAYDQGFNAQLLAEAGAGRPTTMTTMGADLDTLARSGAAAAVRRIAAELTSTDGAVAATVAVIDRRGEP